MKNLYRILANQMYSVLNMSVSMPAQDKMLEIVFKDSPFILKTSDKAIKTTDPKRIDLFGLDDPDPAMNLVIEQREHLRKTLAGVNATLEQKNIDFSELVTRNNKLNAKLGGTTTQLNKAKEEITALELLLDEATKPKVADPTPTEIKEAKKTASSPTFIKGLPDDENPFLPRRDPYTRSKGCALRKHEVWQIRRYIGAGRSYQFIEKTMNVGPSTISSIKHNVSYRSIPMEQRDAPPITVHAGYGVVGQKRKDQLKK